MTDQCFLIMPGDKPCTSGPYNRLRGEKLLSIYEKDARVKGCLMLVDTDFINYLTGDPSNPARFPNLDSEPGRLAQEIADFHDGFGPGPLMKQENLYHRIKYSNKFRNQQLIQDTLPEIQRKASGKPGQPRICYCSIAMPENSCPSLRRDLITCSYRHCTIKNFHKSCVKKLGVENVSRWYCTHCEKQMQLTAYKVLCVPELMEISDSASVQSPRHQDLGHEVKKFAETVDQLFSTMAGELEQLVPGRLWGHFTNLSSVRVTHRAQRRSF